MFVGFVLIGAITKNILLAGYFLWSTWSPRSLLLMEVQAGF